jgi:hypothetical protein
LNFKPLRLPVFILLIAAGGGAFYYANQVAEGQRAFQRLGCPSCHMAGGAPALQHVGRKYNRATFVAWVSNPETVYTRLGRKPLNPGYPPMPRVAASHRDIEAISWFLSSQR